MTTLKFKGLCIVKLLKECKSNMTPKRTQSIFYAVQVEQLVVFRRKNQKGKEKKEKTTVAFLEPP